MLAFTLLELLVVIAILAILAAILLPSVTTRYPRRGAHLLVCMSNQRQILIAEYLWRDDHAGRNHWEVFRAETLTKNEEDANLAAIYFRPLANDYLRNSNLFVCLGEKTRRAVSQGALVNSNLSHGVRLTAVATNPTKSALVVERHLQQSGQALRPGLKVVSSASSLDWTRELHAPKSGEARGVLGFLDGHVEHRKGSKLSEAFDYQNVATNLFVIP